ncbi:MAG: hypothetical protein WDN30_05555 [Pararobbsia sp.]
MPRQFAHLPRDQDFPRRYRYAGQALTRVREQPPAERHASLFGRLRRVFHSAPAALDRR